jgi:ribosomal protein S18 acetylase RimI-like enzyme
LNNLTFNINKSSHLDIQAHLIACNDYFMPPLNSYVDVDDYSLKIFNKALRYEFFKDLNLIGLLAVYVNKDNKGFITNLSVDGSCKGFGLGKKLLDFGVLDLKKRGVQKIDLEVFKFNQKAVNFYLKNQFEIINSTDEKIEMRLTL